MKIIVLIKEVPDMERCRFDSERGVIDRGSAEGEINPFDLYALAAALDLKARCGAHVTAVTMGPERAAATLRDAYARGADACVHITDRSFGGSDTYATSRILASAIARMDYELVLCGEKTVDGDTAQVGAEVAELIGLPHSYYAESIEPHDGYITVTTGELCGAGQQRRMRLPALVAVSRRIAAPKLPTLKRKLESLNAQIERVCALPGLSAEDTGVKGSPTRVAKIFVPAPEHRTGRVFRADADGFIDAVMKAAGGGK